MLIAKRLHPDYRLFNRVLRTMTPEARFWFKVRKTDGCWLWMGAKTQGGYGLIHRTRAGKDTTTHASRLAWEYTFGPAPDELMVCHHCDNPPCVRPEHLFLGTAADNMHDAQRKGRKPTRTPKVLVGRRRGEQHPRTKLTDADVLDIREAYASGLGSLSELAGLYGIHYSGVSRIVNRKRWAHLPDRFLAEAS